MPVKITTITPEQAARFPEWVAKYVEIGLSTEPADFDAATDAALRAYALCNVKRPMIVLRMGSPYGAVLGGILAWGLLKELGKEVRSQVVSQVVSQVESQVWSQVRSQVGSQVVSQVGSQVGSQVESQVESQVWSQVESQVVSQVVSQVESQGESGIYNGRGGAFWASWVGYIAFLRNVLGWTDPVLTERFEIDETLTNSCGWVWWHENVLSISDRPSELHRDEQGRLHNALGPSIAYRDGWALHHFHGVAVPEYVIERPHEIDVAKIDGEGNAEIRRVMLERFGAERYMTECGATVVAELPDTHAMIGLRGARLIKRDLPGDEPIVMVDCVNSSPEPDGSYRRYMLRVDPNAYGGKASRDVLAAMASTWRNADGSLLFKRPQDYKPSVET